jgi:hypothetical protein
MGIVDPVFEASSERPDLFIQLRRSERRRLEFEKYKRRQRRRDGVFWVGIATGVLCGLVGIIIALLWA